MAGPEARCSSRPPCISGISPALVLPLGTTKSCLPGALLPAPDSSGAAAPAPGAAGFFADTGLVTGAEPALGFGAAAAGPLAEASASGEGSVFFFFLLPAFWSSSFLRAASCRARNAFCGAASGWVGVDRQQQEFGKGGAKSGGSCKPDWGNPDCASSKAANKTGLEGAIAH